jgi:ABC-2 type transport system ATP-binding protein
VSAPSAPILVVEDVAKRYGSVRALDAVSLVVEGGEFVALLGLNGAGKTTLFQLLSGLFVADGGTIRIHGHDIGHHPVAALAGIGIVFQQPTLDLDLSVRANLRFHANLHGVPRSVQPQRIAAVMTRLGLSEMAPRKARDLSGGNRRRVELARALLHQPSLLLMDEPTVGLDPATRRDLLQHVLRLRTERNVGVLWATHLIDEAEAADRVVILHRGKVLHVGTPTALAKQAGTADLAEAFMTLTEMRGRSNAPHRSAEP